MQSSDIRSKSSDLGLANRDFTRAACKNYPSSLKIQAICIKELCMKFEQLNEAFAKKLAIATSVFHLRRFLEVCGFGQRSLNTIKRRFIKAAGQYVTT